jgi:hypothetical protein
MYKIAHPLSVFKRKLKNTMEDSTIYAKEPMTGVAVSQAENRFAGIHRMREVVLMTSADIILIFIGIISLLISFGSLIVALLAFLDKRNKQKK